MGSVGRAREHDLAEPNWREMALDLQRGGQSDEDVADAIPVPVGTYRSWKYGHAKPNYMNGKRFVEYHRQRRKLKNQTP